jgi:hypothetical protein
MERAGIDGDYTRKTRLKRRQSGLFLMEQMTPFRHPVTVTFNNEMLEIECLKQDITNIHQTKTVGRYDHGQESGTVSFSFLCVTNFHFMRDNFHFMRELTEDRKRSEKPPTELASDNGSYVASLPTL